MQLNQFNNNLYILSAAKEQQTDELNAERHEELKRSLSRQGVGFAEAEGCYKGKKEKSLILIGTHKMVAHHYACIYRQDCFLKLEPHRDNAYKAYGVESITGDEVFLGFFRSISEDVIEELELDYTKDSAGTFFTIWPSDTVCALDLGCEINHELLKKMETGGK